MKNFWVLYAGKLFGRIYDDVLLVGRAEFVNEV